MRKTLIGIRDFMELWALVEDIWVGEQYSPSPIQCVTEHNNGDCVFHLVTTGIHKRMEQYIVEGASSMKEALGFAEKEE